MAGAANPAPVRLAFSRMALRRRTFAEQRALRMIRGEVRGPDGALPFHTGQFGRLRALAVKHGLTIARLDAPYLTVHELTLLGWLAQGQRVQGYARPFHHDPMLTMTVVHCAGTLDALGIRLPAPATRPVPIHRESA